MLVRETLLSIAPFLLCYLQHKQSRKNTDYFGESYMEESQEMTSENEDDQLKGVVNNMCVARSPYLIVTHDL